MTERLNLHWGVENWYNQTNNLNYTYQNNRITNAGWTYDADGRVLTSSTPDDYIESTYDAKGQLTRMFKQSEMNIYRYYEGGGREAKRKKLTYQSDTNTWHEEIKYFIRSSVLGGEVVSEVNNTGKKLKTYVRAAGTVLAWQMSSTYDNSEYVTFEQSDASGMSQRTTMSDGSAIYGEGSDGAPAELDPMGGNVGLSSPYQVIYQEPPPQIPTLYPMDDASPTYVNGQRVTATLDGMTVPLSLALSSLANGSAVQCPNNYCGSQVFVNSQGQSVISSPFTAYANGTSGYNIPVWQSVNMLDNNGNIVRWSNRRVFRTFGATSPVSHRLLFTGNLLSTFMQANQSLPVL